MIEQAYDVVVVGGGPAGLAAAVSASDNGALRVLVIERDRELGGILQQCIHNGFGLHRFQQELTGPGYAGRYIRMVGERPNIAVLLDTMVLSVAGDKTILAVNPRDGLLKITAAAVVFAMGCRERTRGAIRIPGSRPAGVFTAGAAQRMVNMEGYLPGKKIVILGSGDIGLIMARRLSLEGCDVKAVLEIMPYSNGLTRNVVQCLEDFGIPLHLSHTVVGVHGKDRVTGITCAKVDDALRPVPGSEFDLECDCLLLSVGLIPENELSGDLGIEMDGLTGGPVVDQLRQTSLPGFFAAGNVVHVHDLVDFVSEEGETAGKYAARHACGLSSSVGRLARIMASDGVRTAVPQVVRLDDVRTAPVRLYMRVARPERRVTLRLLSNSELLLERVLPVAKPGEMVVADIPADKLRAIGDVVTVVLRRQGGEQGE
ncbi:NAD(P)/FAD-dependent oxidoreductase [Anaeroselena agilis]|uniref:FAD-dependent oxidoreductase n=1 Tax=Anaeroselena agilis TaxID=3063788 RepID=A0ABU3P4H4_9FIRM|nr:FAD-dependent oxidoreductase [Selenomonadales bacterium 4137-cl]